MKKKQQNSDVLFIGTDGEEVTYEDLLRRIYENAQAKQVHLLQTSEIVKPMIQNIQDAVMLLPMLTGLQSVSVKNDEQLVKLAAIVTRKNKNTGKDSEEDLEAFGITAEMRKEIMEEAQKMSVRPGHAKGD